MPSTSTLGDWISRARVCMLLPPGPEQSSLMTILRRGWLHAMEPASSSAIASRVTSEGQFEGELHHTRVVHRVVDHRKRGGIEIRAGSIATGRAKLRMVEYVKELSTEVHAHAFSGHEVLDNREVRIYEIGTRNWRTVCIAKLSRSRLREAGGVKPCGERGIAQHRIARLIGADEALAVVVQEVRA